MTHSQSLIIFLTFLQVLVGNRLHLQNVLVFGALIFSCVLLEWPPNRVYLAFCFRTEHLRIADLSAACTVSCNVLRR